MFSVIIYPKSLEYAHGDVLIMDLKAPESTDVDRLIMGPNSTESTAGDVLDDHGPKFYRIYCWRCSDHGPKCCGICCWRCFS